MVLKIMWLSYCLKLYKFINHTEDTLGDGRGPRICKRILRVPLKCCESPQPRKRGGEWVLSSHPLKQLRVCARPLLELQVCLLFTIPRRNCYVVAEAQGIVLLTQTPSLSPV